MEYVNSSQGIDILKKNDEHIFTFSSLEMGFSTYLWTVPDDCIGGNSLFIAKSTKI
jgi:hypothetical protein